MGDVWRPREIRRLSKLGQENKGNFFFSNIFIFFFNLFFFFSTKDASIYIQAKNRDNMATIEIIWAGLE